MSGGGAAGGGHPDFGVNAPNQHDAPISGADLAALDASVFDMDDMMAQNTKREMPWYSPLIGISVDQLDPSAHTTNPQLDSLGNPINTAYNYGPFDTRYGYGSGSGLSIAKGIKDFVQDALAAKGSTSPGVYDGMTPGMGPGGASSDPNSDPAGLRYDSRGSRSQQSSPNQSVVSQALNEANARNKTAARERAKAVVKAAAPPVAKPTSGWNLPPVVDKPATPLPPMVIDDPSGPTVHETNVAKRERTKTRLATARGKTKKHLANLRKKGVSKKTMAKARTKAKARYSKIKSR